MAAGAASGTTLAPVLLSGSPSAPRSLPVRWTLEQIGREGAQWTVHGVAPTLDGGPSSVTLDANGNARVPNGTLQQLRNELQLSQRRGQADLRGGVA